MLRTVFRLFLVGYFLMPIVAIGLFVMTFVQIQNDVTPIYRSASTVITNATSVLDQQVQNLGKSLAPLARTVNGIRSALQSVINFLRDTLYTLIDVVNGLNLACSVGNTACIPKALKVTLPTLVDLSFVDTISHNISNITTQINTVVSATTTAINTYVTLLVMGVGVLVIWVVLTYILFFVTLYFGLWKRV